VPSRALSPPATMCGRAGHHPPALVQVLQVSAVEVHLPRPRGSDPCTAMQSHDHRYSHIRAIILFLRHGNHGDSDRNCTRSAIRTDWYMSSWRFCDHDVAKTERNAASPTDRSISDVQKWLRAFVCVAPRTYFVHASVCVWMCFQWGDPFLDLQHI
jgi:hypothetical protein